MHELPDDKIKERLGNYKEEPDKELWQKIMVNVPSKNPSRWIEPFNRGVSLVAVVILLTGLYQLYFNHKAAEDPRGKKSVALRRQDIAGSQDESVDPGSLQLNKDNKTTSAKRETDHNIRSKKKKSSGTGLGERQNQKPARSEFNSSAGNSISSPDQGTKPVMESESGATVDKQDPFPDFSDRTGDHSSDTAWITAFPAMQVLQPVQLKEANTKEDDKGIDRQENQENKKIKIRKGSLYFLVMPTFGYNRIEPNKADNIIIESIQRVPNFSLKRLGVRLEAGFEYPVSGKVSFTGGILYYQRKQTLNYSERVVDSVNTVSTEESSFVINPHYSYLSRSFEYEVKNIGIHVGMNYLLSQGKFVHSIGTGVELHRSLKNTNNTEETGSLGEQPDIFLFYNLFYKLQYPAKGKLKAIFQPTLNYSFYINDNINAPFYIKPYGFGLNIGVSYKF